MVLCFTTVMDYGALLFVQLNFAVGVTRACVDVVTVDDMICEDTESFSVSLSSMTNNADVTTDTVIAVILDNDSM